MDIINLLKLPFRRLLCRRKDKLKSPKFHTYRKIATDSKRWSFRLNSINYKGVVKGFNYRISEGDYIILPTSANLDELFRIVRLFAWNEKVNGIDSWIWEADVVYVPSIKCRNCKHVLILDGGTLEQCYVCKVYLF